MFGSWISVPWLGPESVDQGFRELRETCNVDGDCPRQESRTPNARPTNPYVDKKKKRRRLRLGFRL